VASQHGRRTLRIQKLEQRLALSGLSWNLNSEIDTLNNPDGPWSYNAGAAGAVLALSPN